MPTMRVAPARGSYLGSGDFLRVVILLATICCHRVGWPAAAHEAREDSTVASNELPKYDMDDEEDAEGDPGRRRLPQQLPASRTIHHLGEPFFAVSKEVPGVEMTRLRGKYLTKAFEGPFKDTPKWMRQLQEHVTCAPARESALSATST